MEDTEKTYRILRLIESNFKKIKALDVTPARGVNRVVGKNRAGKSSAIDGIQAAFGGAKCFPDRPVRTGCDQAEIVCVLGDEKPELLIKRVISADGKATLEITSAGGFSAPSPQAILDSLYGRIAFDPQAFLLMEPKRQLELLRQMVGLDFTAMDAERKRLYEERTMANKAAKQAAAQAGPLAVPDDTPEAEVSAADLMAEQKRRQGHNARNQTERDRLKQFIHDAAIAKQLVDSKQAFVNDLEFRLEAARKELDILTTSLSTATATRDGQQLTVDVLEDQNVDEVQKQIIDAQRVNANIAKRRQRDEYARQAAEAEAEAKRLTAEIEAIDASKEKQLADVKWPVAGLSFGEDGVLYDGVPFSQASSAEQARVSFAMGAAMKPRLKVALIRNASLLDSEQEEAFCRTAEGMDMQVFMEIVSSEGGPATVVIEDGEVVSGGNPPDTPLEIDSGKRSRKTKQADSKKFDEANRLLAGNIPSNIADDTNPFLE